MQIRANGHDVSRFDQDILPALEQARFNIDQLNFGQQKLCGLRIGLRHG
jgi:hypothetical protein